MAKALRSYDSIKYTQIKYIASKFIKINVSYLLKCLYFPAVSACVLITLSQQICERAHLGLSDLFLINYVA